MRWCGVPSEDALSPLERCVRIPSLNASLAMLAAAAPSSGRETDWRCQHHGGACPGSLDLSPKTVSTSAAVAALSPLSRRCPLATSTARCVVTALGARRYSCSSPEIVARALSPPIGAVDAVP
jgi:hypothetical protein